MRMWFQANNCSGMTVRIVIGHRPETCVKVQEYVSLCVWLISVNMEWFVGDPHESHGVVI